MRARTQSRKRTHAQSQRRRHSVPAVTRNDDSPLLGRRLCATCAIHSRMKASNFSCGLCRLQTAAVATTAAGAFSFGARRAKARFRSQIGGRLCTRTHAHTHKHLILVAAPVGPRNMILALARYVSPLALEWAISNDYYWRNRCCCCCCCFVVAVVSLLVINFGLINNNNNSARERQQNGRESVWLQCAQNARAL